MLIPVPDDAALLELVEFLRRRDCIVTPRPDTRQVRAECPHLSPAGERIRIDELVAQWRQETGR